MQRSLLSRGLTVTQDAVLATVAAVLHLGNIEFVQSVADEAELDGDLAWTSLGHVSELLQASFSRRNGLSSILTRLLTDPWICAGLDPFCPDPSCYLLLQASVRGLVMRAD